ncbi:MAG TPA: hypothetical protein DCR35_10365 [Runella sp.]|nr:hypothetical protein [Runella sp.]HAO49665.1 hypothetical protein [Runella sp.]
MASERNEVDLRGIILEQATKLFKLFGYNKLVMDDIARAIGKSRSTIYLYFKDKEDIFSAIVRREIDAYLHELANDLPNHTTAMEQLRAYLRIKFDFRYAKAAEFLIMNREGHPELLAKMRVYTDPPEVQYLSKIIQFGIKNGECKAMSEANVALLAKLLISAFNGIANDVLTDVESTEVSMIHVLLDRIFIQGLGQNLSNR